MSPRDKPLVWLHGEVKTPPFGWEARIEAGYLLRRLQQGDSIGLPRGRPMPSVGSRCHELRVNDAGIDVFGSTTMRASKREKLGGRGWRVGDASEFPGLSAEEEALISLRLKLAGGLKDRRVRKRLTQVDLAKAVNSSQSRVAKMEAGDPTVSIDLLVRSLIALGASSSDLARIITAR